MFGSSWISTTTGAGTITTTANSVNIFGDVTLTTAGTAATLGNNNSGALADFHFGQVGGLPGAGKLTVYENTTLNLGNITAASIDASSLRGDIVNTGKLNLTDAAVTNFFAANSIFTPGSIALTNATNTIAGTVGVSNAANFSLVNAANTTVQIGTIANGRAVSGTTSVTVTGGTNTLTLSNASGGDIGIVAPALPELSVSLRLAPTPA